MRWWNSLFWVGLAVAPLFTLWGICQAIGLSSSNGLAEVKLLIGILTALCGITIKAVAEELLRRTDCCD